MKKYSIGSKATGKRLRILVGDTWRQDLFTAKQLEAIKIACGKNVRIDQMNIVEHNFEPYPMDDDQLYADTEREIDNILYGN